MGVRRQTVDQLRADELAPDDDQLPTTVPEKPPERPKPSSPMLDFPEKLRLHLENRYNTP